MENPARHRDGAGQGAQRDRPDRLRRQHRRASCTPAGSTRSTTPIVEESLRVNYLGPLHIARAAIGYLRESKGQLLLYTSSSYTRGRAGYSLYSSAKAATVNLTQALADEWADEGVRVNCINPERTATPMRTRAFGRSRPVPCCRPATSR